MAGTDVDQPDSDQAADGQPGEPDLPSPYADPDSFWNGGEVHDLVGGRQRGWRPDAEDLEGGLGGDEDALVVDLTERRAESEDGADDAAAGPSGRRRGGRRRR